MAKVWLSWLHNIVIRLAYVSILFFVCWFLVVCTFLIVVDFNQRSFTGLLFFM